MKPPKESPGRILLNTLKEIGELMPMPFETPYAYIRRAGGLNRQRYSQLTNRMKKQGVVEIFKKAGKKFIKLTDKGQIKILMQKSRLPHVKAWDGKWRIVMFDIPERARQKRDQLRRLLKTLNYRKLQESVFLSPHPINREGVEYLKKSGLIEYIRILRVDEMDDEKQFLKKFSLRK